MSLSDSFTRLNLTTIAGLNLLTEHGLISDLCVTIEDVAKMDAEQAVAFLESIPLDIAK